MLLRLARFNSAKSSDFFIGLPCPLGAIFVSLSFIISSKFEVDATLYKEIFVFLTVLVSFLMISKFSYFSFKNFGSNEKIKFYWLFFVIFLLVITLINPIMVLFVLAIIYSLSGPTMHVIRQFKKRKTIHLDKNRDDYGK